MAFVLDIFRATWEVLLDSGIYILGGLVMGGLLQVFLSPALVARHLGRHRVSSVFKAALFGIPLPLCSCSVLPAAAALKRQGANNGATTAFLISTPESGVDSISVSWALLDPLLTVARPVTAFVTAMVAGLTENLLGRPAAGPLTHILGPCTVDGCCDGQDCDAASHRRHHSLGVRALSGVRYGVTQLWEELAGWFFVGLLLAGLAAALLPDDFLGHYLGGGLSAMLLMLVLGLPIYICATASTPLAAALILKGVSPGAALVFLLAGPATNMATLSVLVGLLGRRAVILYLTAIGVVSVGAGLAVDFLYATLGLDPRAVVGQAGEALPQWLRLSGALALLALSLPWAVRRLRALAAGKGQPACGCAAGHCHGDQP